MIWKYYFRSINQLNYLTGTEFVSNNSPDIFATDEFPKPFAESIFDVNVKPQWVFNINPDYNSEIDPIDDRYLIEHKPIPLIAEEIETKRLMEVKAKISAELPDLIYANKDDPAALSKALTDRVKEIDAETTLLKVKP